MAAVTSTVLAGAAIVSAVGAGVAAYGQYQAGRTQDAIAQFNAKAQERNARLQLLSMQASAAAQKQAAAANFALASQQAQAHYNNAKSIENQALGQDRINREIIRRRREQFGEAQGAQRAAIAASGVVESSGTPLDLVSEMAGTIQRDQEEQLYNFEMERRTLFREAQMERLGGDLAMAGATLDRSSSLREASLTAASARMQYLSGRREAEITRLTGRAAKQAGTIGAAATLFSGLGNAAQVYSPS